MIRLPRFRRPALSICFALGAIAMGMLTSDAHGQAAQPAGELLVYVGTYSGPQSQGIYVCRLDLSTGKCTPLSLAAEVKNASFLAIHPSRKFLYSVSEIEDLGGKPTGGVSAFTIDRASGKLTKLNHQSSEGRGPCHVTVDKTGRVAMVANYGGGSIASLPIGEDGKLAPAASAIQHVGKSANPQRQEGPHAHSINPSPDNRFAVAADLGLDKVLVYQLDPSTGKLAANDPPSVSVKPGAGPRHFAFHPSGKHAYVINEIDCTVTAFDYDAQRGMLTEIQTVSTLPDGEKVEPGYSTAEVQVHPSGKFVYGSNRGHDTITVFAVDEATGKLRQTQNVSTEGKTPRGFGIDPSGRFLLAGNQDSHTITASIQTPASSSRPDNNWKSARRCA
jgi:6-phosphogluconolactonase